MKVNVLIMYRLCVTLLLSVAIPTVSLFLKETFILQHCDRRLPLK